VPLSVRFLTFGVVTPVIAAADAPTAQHVLGCIFRLGVYNNRATTSGVSSAETDSSSVASQMIFGIIGKTPGWA
jgi:hypothetical protein